LTELAGSEDLIVGWVELGTIGVYVEKEKNCGCKHDIVVVVVMFSTS
jgi:hypothetical protein